MWKQAGKNALKAVYTFAFGLIGDLIKDRYIGAINRWLDANAPSYSHRVLSWMLNAKFSITILALIIFALVLLAHAFVVSRRSSAQEDKPETLATPTRASDVPRIYIADWLDETHLFVPASPIVLENRGKEVAHAVQVLPVTIFYKEVKFDYVDTIAVGDKKKVFPRIQQSDGEGNTLFYLLRKELEARNQAQGKQEASISLPLTIIYKDPSGIHNCETIAELIYTPINRETSAKAKQHGWEDWPHETYAWHEIRHNEFKCT